MARYYLYSSVLIIAILAIVALAQYVYTPNPIDLTPSGTRSSWRTPIIATGLLSATCQHLLTNGNLTAPILPALAADLNQWNAPADQAPLKATMQAHASRLQTALDEQDTEAVFGVCAEIEVMTRTVYREADRDGVTGEDMNRIWEELPVGEGLLPYEK